MPASMELPWPQCLGTFDEESCRYLLHQIGSRTVPRYPFSFGMEEVHSLLLARYGREGVSDATSLLQELLEDDQNATGLGDDGDIWRSWRHSWRHRNDDSLNPFIPHVGTFVLPPSTRPNIRLLKAANFVLSCRDDTSKSSNVGGETREPSECSSLTPDVHGLSLEEHTFSCTNLSHPVTKPRNDLCEISSRASATSIGPDLSTLFTFPGSVVESSERLDAHHIDVEVPVVIDRSGKSKHRRAVSLQNSVVASSSACQPLHSPRDLGSGCRAASVALIHECATDSTSQIRRAGEADNNCMQNEVLNGSSSGERNASPVVVQETTSHNVKEDQLASIAKHRRRTVNREARLIDGTIFTSTPKFPETISQSQVTTASEPTVDSNRPSLRLSWSLKQRDSLRNNIRNEIRQLFNRENVRKTTFESKKHLSVTSQNSISNGQHRSSMSTSIKRPNTSIAATIEKPSSSPFGLDGAADALNSPEPLVNLNKPLPLSPADIVRSMSTKSQLSTSHYSGTTSNPQSAKSTGSSLSKTSSKKEFKDLASDLFPQNVMHPHDLPPICEIGTGYKRVPEPQKIPMKSTTPVSYTSISEANPFIDIDRPRSPLKPSPLNFSTSQRAHEAKLTAPTYLQSEDAEGPLLPPKPDFIRKDRPVQNKDVDEIVERGRNLEISRPMTPTKREDLPPKTPPKRSRSPIKRFLGLAKSNSATKSETHDTPPQTSGQDNSAKKDSLKKWGNRLRYGFLTPDQEQLRQEELIEQHNHESNSPTPQNSTFPVSLEPPLQAKVQSEIELILSVSANRYLMHEAKAGRVSAESVAKTKDLWDKMNRPQVVEFHYDQITQHNLVMANLDRVKLHGDAATDAIAINSTMRGWKMMAKELSIRTFCSPDSVIRKHLHDAHRVLELLGAPLVTFLAYEDMQLKTLSTITHRQKERMDRRTGSQSRDPSGSSGILQMHRRNFSEGSQHYDYLGYPAISLQMDKIRISPSPTPYARASRVRKPTGGEGAIMSLPTNFEKSRDQYASTTTTTTSSSSRFGKS